MQSYFQKLLYHLHLQFSACGIAANNFDDPRLRRHRFLTKHQRILQSLHLPLGNRFAVVDFEPNVAFCDFCASRSYNIHTDRGINCVLGTVGCKNINWRNKMINVWIRKAKCSSWCVMIKLPRTAGAKFITNCSDWHSLDPLYKPIALNGKLRNGLGLG